MPNRLRGHLYRLLARTMRGYADAHAKTIFRDLIDIPATVTVGDNTASVRLHRRSHLPIIIDSGLLNRPAQVPWWNGATRWEFVEGDRELTIAVDGRVITNDPDTLVRAALDGLGIAYVIESSVADHLAAGTLVRLLAPYCPRFPGLHLYYPSRRQVPAKLRALVDFFHAHR
jgi:DNA-binding transcriptional LysR family regulator